MTSFRVLWAAEDGDGHELEPPLDDLGEACARALKHAERLSNAASPNDAAEPAWIRLCDDDALVIAIRIMPGKALTG